MHAYSSLKDGAIAREWHKGRVPGSFAFFVPVQTHKYSHTYKQAQTHTEREGERKKEEREGKGERRREEERRREKGKDGGRE